MFVGKYYRLSVLPLSSPHLPQAALMGGTTMVMAVVLPEQHCSLLDAYENCRALADAKACCDYALLVGVTWWGPKVRANEGDVIYFYRLQFDVKTISMLFLECWMNYTAAKPF